MWYVFWIIWRRYSSISFSNSSFFGVGCIIWISNTILGKHMNVKMVFMLISICWWYICKRVGRIYTFSLKQTCEFIYRDSTWFSNTRWHTICFWTLATKIFVFLFFFIKLDFFYCVREKNSENFSTRKFCTAQMWDEIVHLIWFFQSCKTFGFRLNYLVYSDLIYHFNV